MKLVTLFQNRFAAFLLVLLTAFALTPMFASAEVTQAVDEEQLTVDGIEELCTNLSTFSFEAARMRDNGVSRDYTVAMVRNEEGIIPELRQFMESLVHEIYTGARNDSPPVVRQNVYRNCVNMMVQHL